jgi:polysaccharide export outer membrane protein
MKIHRIKTHLSFLILALTTTPLAHLGAQTLTQPPGSAVMAIPSSPASHDLPTSANYRISPGDMFDFRVFQEEDLNMVVRVAGDGTAIFPLIGTAKVSGMTVAEASHMLEGMFRQGYLVHPQVSIIVRSFSKKYYTFFGQVSKPGAYDLEGMEEIPLLQAIGAAGGFTKIANPSNITVKRTVDGNETVIHLNARKMASGHDKSVFMIRAGDVITVGESLF